MARNNSNNSGSGCGIVCVLGILWFAGNAALFDSSVDLPFLSVMAVIGDVIAIWAIIKAIVNKSSANKSSQTTASSQPSVRQTGTRRTSPPPPSPATSANEDNSRLNQLKSKYRVPDVPSIAISVDPLQKEIESYQCVEVLQSVNKAINLRRDYAKKIKSLSGEIEAILACPGCDTDREKLKYIRSNEEALQQKKNAYITATNEMKQIRVNLLSKEKAAFNKLYSALLEIGSSEKSTSGSGVALSAFVKLRSSIPDDLFVSEQTPIELNYGAYRFFLLPDVVLAFDKTNNFVTAFEPMALVITFTDLRKSVYMSRSDYSSWSYSDPVIAKDSVLVSEGYTRTSWLHEKRNGGPDLRYTYNPRSESRSDIYAYSSFSIQIGSYKAEYLLSKANLSVKLKPMVQEYCSIMHELNAIPSLLRLMESVAKKGDAARVLSEQYESVNKNTICKVR